MIYIYIYIYICMYVCRIYRLIDQRFIPLLLAFDCFYVRSYALFDYLAVRYEETVPSDPFDLSHQSIDINIHQ